MEKGVKQESSYPLLAMKRDQTNKTNAEGVYRQQALVCEPGPDKSGVDPWLFREWAQHSHTSCAHTRWSWSGMEADGQSGSRQGWTEAECGRGLPRGADKGETKGKRKGKRARVRSYHDSMHLDVLYAPSLGCTLTVGVKGDGGVA